jgi:hypothetical protein
MFSANENLTLRAHKRAIVQHIESTMSEDVLDLGVNVMVMQVSCKAPGCVPLETAIIVVFPKSSVELLPGLPESNGGSFKTKILKPMAEVTQQDVLEALPPSFAGGLFSMERMYLQARDVMLGQITQLFGDDENGGDAIEGKQLMAQYLQESLQLYMDRGCVPPEPGQDYAPAPVQPSSKTRNGNDQFNEIPSNSAATLFGTTGNVVIRRKMDSVDSATVAPQPESQSNGIAKTSGPLAAIPQISTKFTAAVAPSTVNSVSKRRQQAAADRMLNNSTDNSSTLQRLVEREHAPGIRRAGCPCCDPDHPSNFIDQMMQL